MIAPERPSPERQAIHPRSTHKPVLHWRCMSDYECLVKLGAKALAERDRHVMPGSVTTPEAFYEVMAAAVLDAIDLPALLERVTHAEQELEVIQQALRQADLEAEHARHKATIDEESSVESTIASILTGSDTSPGPVRAERPRPRPVPMPRAPDHRDAVDKRRKVSVLPPPFERSEQMRPPPQPPPPPRQPPSRTRRARRGARKIRVNHFHSISWPKLLLLRRPLRRAAT